VRVVGGFTEHQFAEKRLPTLAELNAVAPDTPVFILHLYDRALLNAAALRAVGYTKDTPEPPGGEILRDSAGNPTGLLLAKPNASILYATLAKGPSCRGLPGQFHAPLHARTQPPGRDRRHRRGGGLQNYPDDYDVIQELADADQLTIRLAYNLFTQKPKEEKDDFLRWTASSQYKQGTTTSATTARARCWCSRPPTSRTSASPAGAGARHGRRAEEVVRILAQNRWPWRMHATYDETIAARSMCSRRSTDIPWPA
jgi:predicted amidohydrolase YtcJ